jgi:hypothetical protein
MSSDKPQRALTVNISGDLLGELMVANTINLIMSPVVGRRLRSWFIPLNSDLADLVDRENITIDELKASQPFVSTMLQATQIAARSHQEEKIAALRNAVLNSALPSAPEDALQQMFLSYIDAFTEWHLRILMFFHNPQKWGEEHNIKWARDSEDSVSRPLDAAFPELRGQGYFCAQVASDLYTRSLITASAHDINGSIEILKSQTTDFGKRFMKLIMPPAEK